ncbi:MAG: hypothetical protein ABI461_06405, partial [Polyangiaceae bacterium]
MNWFKNLFRSDEVAEPPVVEKKAPPAERTISPIGLAKRFAKKVPGARIEEFDGTERDDGILSRITFTHEGVESRIVLKDYGDGALVAWLQTRCVGIFGFFNVVHIASTAKEEEVDGEPKEARLYLTSDCYIFGPRLRNEVARLRTLPENVQSRLIALAEKVDLVKLDEEVFAVVIGDLFDLTHILED